MTILFAVCHALSHHNATYKLARTLQARGHRVLYVETLPFIKASILAQGFEVVRVAMDRFPAPEPPPKPGTSLWQRGKALFRQLGYIRRVNEFILDGTLYDDLVAQLRPDLVMLDTDFVCNSVLLYKYRIPLAIIQTCVSLDKDPYVPVFTTALPFGKTPGHYLLAEASWLAYFAKNLVDYLRDKVWFSGIDKRMRDYPLLKKIAAQTGFPLNQSYNSSRALHVGFTNLPEFITSPREFDFPRTPRPNQHYVSPAVDLHRRESFVDPAWAGKLATLQQQHGAEAKPVVYCSLGTLSHYQYRRCGDFYHKVIEVFRARPDLTLVLVAGPFAPTYDHASLPGNIYLLKAIPQLEILPLATLMITHGGMNSLTECIYFGVPVVVYPLSTNFDQPGNAARAVYHGLGVQGNIRRDSTTQLASHVAEVLTNPTYRQRMDTMRQRVVNSDDFDKSVQLIEALCNQSLVVSSRPVGPHE
ncbi:nucleotide disphospho-sugar-binding domain-containing protein [Fibrella aquatilis]|uniref:Glycosyltransferase family 1 protein n=1 Tax=Fibrella aquatilis TaxID=2817059 RepID=A0A939K0Q4_9BACT|nr:glycosyltransferase [Fibrella aquatilis]MBO0931465.1 glycosyltransferase family 1 protein [Fibrella aquatilis]